MSRGTSYKFGSSDVASGSNQMQSCLFPFRAWLESEKRLIAKTFYLPIDPFRAKMKVTKKYCNDTQTLRTTGYVIGQVIMEKPQSADFET